MNNEEQKFLNDLDKKLWTAADKLRSNLDAAVYKHAVLGLIFLKYVSDAFEERRKELLAAFTNPNNDYYLGEDADDLIHEELEIRDYYTEKNVFWVPAMARWENLQNNAKVAPGTEIEIKNGKTFVYKFTSIGKLIDDALDAVEKENEKKLKGVLNKTYTQLQIEPAKLGELIDLIATVPFSHQTLHAKDILGHVYEYFLGQFALSEGKKGGQYYTPKAIVTLIVEMLQPYKGRVYDPAMGSGGFFVQSERFIEEHKGRLGDISVYGQESNPTTWRLAAMNMAIRGLDFNFGGEPANTFSNDKHPDLRADFVMANPPFNMKEWNTGVKDDDPRWQYGTPPAGNANFAWLQHMLYHLAPNGSMALLLANGSMSSNTNNEGEIRKRLLEEDRVECMVALPGQLFTNTQIPACIWFLTKNKKAHNGFRDRSNQVLFIDARNMGYMKDRVLRDFTAADIQKIAETFHNWRTTATDGGSAGNAGAVAGAVGLAEQSEAQQIGDVGLPDVSPTYQDVPAFCKSATLDEIRQHDYVLTPGRYVGAAEQEDDGEPFADKMARLTAQLKEQFEQSDKLEAEIKKNLAGLGYEF